MSKEDSTNRKRKAKKEKETHFLCAEFQLFFLLNVSYRISHNQYASQSIDFFVFVLFSNNWYTIFQTVESLLKWTAQFPQNIFLNYEPTNLLDSFGSTMLQNLQVNRNQQKNIELKSALIFFIESWMSITLTIFVSFAEHTTQSVP